MTAKNEKPLTGIIKPGRQPVSIEEYEKAGGYQGLRKALKMPPKQIQQMVSDSNLLGRGGAGFPTGKKWSLVRLDDDSPRTKYFVVNADEMEPGTFKDKLLLEGNPHSIVEGAIISSFAVETTVCYVFIRWAYKLSAERIQRAIDEAYAKNYLGKNILGSGYNLEMYVHVSAGRYMCGEENGLLNVLEGKRLIPRAKPPYTVTCGLWGKPTVVDNVETIANVPSIIDKGSEWFKNLSYTNEGGTKLYAISGRVKRPGVWELPMGTTVREILEDYAGGMQDGYKFRAMQPGGASTRFIVEEHLDARMDFANMLKTGSRLGTATMIVLDDKTCPIGMISNNERFFARESCGWCTPCREGLPWIRKTLEAIEEGKGQMQDLEILQEQCWLLGPGHTFCALAPGAIEPLESGLKYFRVEFERHIKEHRCPRR